MLRDLTSNGWTWDDGAQMLIVAVALWIGLLALGAWATLRASKAANRRGRV